MRRCEGGHNQVAKIPKDNYLKIKGYILWILRIISILV